MSNDKYMPERMDEFFNKRALDEIKWRFEMYYKDSVRNSIEDIITLKLKICLVQCLIR